MAMSDKIAAFLARNQQQNRAVNQATSNTTTIYGIAAEDSADGCVKVIIPGADVIQPEDADGNQIGDNSVVVPIIGSAEAGDEIAILGVGNGIADVPIVVGAAGSGDRTRKIATEAQDAIDATNQHFYDDSNGIHVVTEDGDPTTGPNLLANSLGILLMNGTLIMSSQTPSGFAVYDGLGNNLANILAQFGATIVLGKSGNIHMEIDDQGMELLNQGGYTNFYVGYDPSVKVGNNPAPFFLFGDDGSMVSRSIGAYSACFGLSNQASGMLSFSAGTGNDASGTGSVAFGTGNKAVNAGEFACGSYNEEDATGNKLFSVGNGTSNNARKDAFAVYKDGSVLVNGMSIPRTTTLYNNTAGSFTGVITLSDDVQNYEYLEVFYKDTEGVSSSVKIYDFTVGSKFECSTENYFVGGAGISIKSRTMYFISYTTLDTYFTAQPGGNAYWTGEYVYDGSQHLNTGAYIGITRIVGYR